MVLSSACILSIFPMTFSSESRIIVSKSQKIDENTNDRSFVEWSRSIEYKFLFSMRLSSCRGPEQDDNKKHIENKRMKRSSTDLAFFRSSMFNLWLVAIDNFYILRSPCPVSLAIVGVISISFPATASVAGLAHIRKCRKRSCMIPLQFVSIF